MMKVEDEFCEGVGASRNEDDDVIEEVEPGRPTKVAKTSNTTGDKEYNEMYDKLTDAMRPFCRIHDVGFSSFVHTDADEVGYYLDGKVQLILTDPPYNTRKQKNAPNSSHDDLSLDQMEECGALFDRLLRPGGHGIVFCSELQFSHWHRLLYERKRPKEHEETEEDVSQPLRNFSSDNSGDNVCNVEDIAQNFNQAPGHYFRNPGQKRCSHMSVVQKALHFWKRGMSRKEEFELVNYKLHGHIPSCHEAWTNCTDNIPRIDAIERVYTPDENGNPTRNFLRPEQKSIAHMSELICKYTNEGDIVVDTFGGCFTGGKAGLSLKNHRKFVGCDSDPLCVEGSNPILVDTFARQLLNKESDISGTEELLKTAHAFLSHPKYASKAAAKHASQWDAPPGLPMYQILDDSVHRFVASVKDFPQLSLKFGKRPPQEWPTHYRSALNTMDPILLRAVEATARCFIVCRSTIKHKNAGLGVYTKRPFRKGEFLLPYYSILVYTNLGDEEETTKGYGSGILEVRKRTFLEKSVKLRSSVQDKDGVEHDVYIVPAPFCVASYINDARYLPGDEDAHESKTDRARKPNCRMIERDPSSHKERGLISNKLLSVEALREIRVNEELFMDYGKGYTSWSPISHDIVE